MYELTTDPTAGRTARELREHPELPHPIRDVTDPRSRQPAAGRRESGAVTDPTDPRAGKSRH
jgi:hypothetical protein